MRLQSKCPCHSRSTILASVWGEFDFGKGSDFLCREFFHLAVAGLAIGLGFGMVTSLFLYIMYQKKIEEMTLTIAAAYSTYIVADQLAGASGVLAVVALGNSLQA